MDVVGLQLQPEIQLHVYQNVIVVQTKNIVNLEMFAQYIFYDESMMRENMIKFAYAKMPYMA